MEMVLPRAAPILRAHSTLRADDESDLIARARAGEIGALDELMNRHRARILNLTFQITRDRDLAEDCAQEAFVRAFSKLAMFRAQSSLATWLYRIALNAALEKTRAKPSQAEALDEQIAAPHFMRVGDNVERRTLVFRAGIDAAARTTQPQFRPPNPNRRTRLDARASRKTKIGSWQIN